MADKIVTICHPQSEGTAETTEASFLKIWKRKGWQIAPPPPPPQLEESDFVDPEASGFTPPGSEDSTDESPAGPGWETSDDGDEDDD